MRLCRGPLVLAGLAACGPVVGQGPTRTPAQAEIVVELAPDPAGSGPEALLWLRDERVPAAAGWPREGDPRGAVEITFGAGLVVSARPSSWTAPESGGPTARVRVGGMTVATARNGSRGEETLVLCEGAEVPALARELGDLLGSGPRLSRDLRVDLPSLLGAFGTLRECSDPGATRVALLAAYVGEVRLAWRREGAQAVLHGKSAGGLVVPLALAWAGYAALRASRAEALAEGEAITVRAQALRDSGREEAARQLARIATPTARDALLRLCRSDEYTRVLAMEALARRGDPTTLHALVDAATETMPDSIEVAREALLAQWDTVGAEQKQSLLTQLRGRREGDLRGVSAELGSARLAALPGTGAKPSVSVESTKRPSPLWLLLPLALGLVLLARAR